MPASIKYPEMTVTREDQYPEAAEDLYNSMVGKGCNKDELIRITRQFNALERARIAEVYEQKYSKSLISTFDEELKGDLLMYFKVIYSPYYEEWAQWINTCATEKKNDLENLSEMIFCLTKDDFEEVKKAYQQKFSKDLAEDVVEEIKESEIALLVKTYLETSNKYGADAEKLADYLFEDLSKEETEKRFINILCNCHPRIYKEVCEKMKEKYEIDMDKLIEKRFSGKKEFAFLDAHFMLIEHKNGVARLLKETMKGAGTDEAGLIRITELFGDRMKGGLIKESYEEIGDVAKDIKDDLSGKDEDLILALWGLE